MSSWAAYKNKLVNIVLITVNRSLVKINSPLCCYLIDLPMLEALEWYYVHFLKHLKLATASLLRDSVIG